MWTARTKSDVRDKDCTFNIEFYDDHLTVHVTLSARIKLVSDRPSVMVECMEGGCMQLSTPAHRA